jgi:inner membrane protein
MGGALSQARRRRWNIVTPMASFGHVAIGMAAGRAFLGRDAEKKKVFKAMAAFSALSLWPDLDYIGFVAGIPYEAPLGHRGATHSLIVALAVGAIAFLLAKRWGYPPLKLAIIVTLVGMSHGIADSMTFGGGLGCALFWPLGSERIWMPGPEEGAGGLRFIPVAPLGLGMLSKRGAVTVFAELFIFSPFLLYATFPSRKKKTA